ncbi:MAG TPA: GGDEF domain-containing protein [Thermodesulfobacteriota bacterium]|nr:diguanylate cyclase [Deltaproteobacteria bacterium]HNU72545.1 GGDEF domain-containing protein [Thermodesulfobacteriota bacterium]
MKILDSMGSENFRRMFMAFYAGSVILPTLIIVYVVLAYIAPHLTQKQVVDLGFIFFWSCMLMIAFSLGGVILVLRRIRQLETLTREVRESSRDIILLGRNEVNTKNEINTLHNVFACLQQELQEKLNELNSYGQKIMDHSIYLSELAITDTLTSCYNRRFFDVRISEEISRSERYDSNFSLIMVDVDNFKEYNDTLGHQSGDELLQQIASIVKHSVRKTDLVFRYGGDEFVVICPNTGIQGANILASRICEGIPALVIIPKVSGKGISRPVTISGGVVDYASCKGNIVEAADRYLYQAKNMGRGIIQNP